MQVLAGVIFFIILLISGIVGIIISIAGLIISRVMRRSGRRFAKAVKVISIIWLIGSIVLTAIPTSFFGFIFYINSTPPEDYVDTDIIIEGDIYQNDYFTADGKVYRLLDLDAYYDGCKEKATPVFSYKPEGILNRAQWQNYYRIENERDFDLIWNGSNELFCTDDEREAIIEYYNSSEYAWTYTDVTDYDEEDPPVEQPVPDDLKEALKLYMSLDTSKLSKIEFSYDDYDERTVANIEFIAISHDVVLVDVFYIDILADGVYEGLENDFGETDDDSDDKVIALRLPEEIAAALSKLAAK